MKVYIAGKYSANTQKEKQANIAAAVSAGQKLLRRGHTPFVPHSMTAGWEKARGLRYEDFIRMDLEWLACCDAILLLPGWENSCGARQEYEQACCLGLPMYYDTEAIPAGSLVLDREESEL